MLNHSSLFEENVLSQRQRSSKKNSRNMKAYEKKRFENGSQEIKHFMIIDSVSPPTRSFQDPLASCFTDSPLKTSDLASNVLTSNFNFSHHTPNKHDYLMKETLPTNDKDRLLRDILVRLNLYKRHWNNVKGFSDLKLQLNNPFYYDYLNEKDDFTLKVLIQILYEEIENLSDFFEQNSLSQKEDYDKMEQRLREKDSLCTSIVKETLEQKSTIAQYVAKIEESDKKSSGYINCISDLQRVLQSIFEDIFCSKFELGSEKKLEIGNLIKNTLNNIPYFIQESTIDRTRRESSDHREQSQQHFSPITSVKRELTYSDLMDVVNKDFKDSPPAGAVENLNQIKNSPKADLRQLLFDNRYSSPHSNGRQDEDDFEFKKHRRSFSFNKNSFASANISPNRRIPEELANMNNQLIQKTKDLEESLMQANKTIASLLEERNSLEPIVKQLRIQKDELAIKLQAFDTRPNLEERLATFMSEGPGDELSKSLNFPDAAANTHPMREDLKAVLKVMKEAEEKIVSFYERTSYQTNFSYENERPNSLKRINTASLSKIREGSDFSEEAKGFFDHHHLDALETLQTKLKNSQEIHKLLIKQYENKVLDTIEKLEDMKGMCNLVLTTNQNMVRVNDDHTPARLRALQTELERKNANIQEKIKRIEQDQEVNRLELEELIRQEEFVEEFYKQDQRPTLNLNDGKPPQIKNESLIAENHELNEMIQMLSQEITSLKSQLKLQAVVDHSPLLEPLSTRSTRRLSRDSSYHATLNEKQRIPSSHNLINQNDFYYMLNAQATSLEALLS